MGTDGRVSSGSNSTGVEATQTSLDVLELIKERGPVTLTAIADELGRSKSTIHRHVATLEHSGYITTSPDGYRIGLLFLDYGIQAQRDHVLYDAATEKVDALAADVGEKVWCMTEENGLAVFLYHRDEKGLYDTYTRVGYRGHLHAFSSGKAVLAHLPEETVRRIVDRHGLPAYTEETITDYGDLLEELEAVRRRGVAFNRGEAVKRGNALAAPILDDDGTPLGSLGVAGPAHRLSGEYLEHELPERLLGIANEIEVSLEYE